MSYFADRSMALWSTTQCLDSSPASMVAHMTTTFVTPCPRTRPESTPCVCVYFWIIKGRRSPAFFLCFQTGSLWGFPFSGFAAIEWGRRGAEPLLSASALSKQALRGRRVRVLSFSWTVKVQSNFVLRAGWAQLGYATLNSINSARTRFQVR